MKRTLSRFIFSLALVSFFPPACALNFYYSSRFPNDGSSGAFGGWARQLTLSGTIERGDTEKFVAFLKSNPNDARFGLYQVVLDSPGGNVLEAMKLAQLLKQFYPDTVVKGTCASSCLLLWLSGGAHFLPTGLNRIGVHRPYFDPKEFSKLSMTEARSQYAILADKFKSFVLQQGLPQSIYEKLMVTSSNDIYWLTPQDLVLTGVASPAYDERFKSECGHFPNGPEKRKCRNTMLRPERVKALQTVLSTSQ